eukprot:CAMPEP_0174269066 /NCGR_PEP_ID=MMETSP0439-20130205/39740_1 /TAXON_ID=0 /ORGANISM="Stereomyxa ramosa, Strain Chinc5" /LENGTH=247 /DNA_ID=CAMNT_0015357633 /DNA_START=262 /DNA_END=1002 /DNA_ORIENTATION=-
MGWIGEYCIAALFGGLMFHPTDLIGAKYMWWTWHNSDPLYSNRDHGVPPASPFWVMAYIGGLAVTLRIFCGQKNFDKWGSFTSFVVLPVVVGFVSSFIVMTFPFNLIFHPMILVGGFSAFDAMIVFRVLLFVGVIYAVFKGNFSFRFSGIPNFFTLLTLIYIGTLVTVTMFEPEKVRSTSYRQAIGGDCEELETCFWGAFERKKFLCPSTVGDNEGLFSFSCLDLQQMPLPNQTWYTVCGEKVPEEW